MTSVTTKPELSQPTTESNFHLFDGWFDPIETGIRDRVRGLIEEMICGELDAVLSRPYYGRRAVAADGSDVAPDVTGHRHGRRVRTLTGTFGKTEIAVPRARLNAARRQDDGMEEPVTSGISASHAGRRRVDRGHLSGRH